MINRFRRKFFGHYLRKRLKGFSPRRTSQNFEQARAVGIIFDGSDEANFATVSAYAKDLTTSGKTVQLLGYINLKKIQEEPPFPYFSRKHLNWYGRPDHPSVTEFVAMNFDVLVCAYNNECPPLDWVAAFSKALLRVGCYDNDKTYCHDLMINVPGEHITLSHTLKEFDKYLKMIRVEEPAL